MFTQPPLEINCDGLNQKLVFELADRLSLHFVKVEVFGDKIYASKPLSNFHYEKAWALIEAFGVTAI